jgi:hypothetical protein
MNKPTYIANELKQIAPDVNWPAETPFTVPAGYFDELPAAILLQIQLEDLRSGMPAVQQNPTIPAGYFDGLPQSIMQRIKAEEPLSALAELTSLSPFLAEIPKQVPFTVPDGYFDTLQVGHLPANPLRVVHRNKVSTWLKWTVAACLTAFIGSSAILFIINDNNHTTIIEKKLEDLNDQDIVEYLQTHTDPFDNDAIFASSASVEAAPVQNQLNKEVPLEAIEKYLQQTDLSKEVLPEKK